MVAPESPPAAVAGGGGRANKVVTGQAHSAPREPRSLAPPAESPGGGAGWGEA